MKKLLDVMIDIETLSLSANAAIIQIAAKPFRLDGKEVILGTDKNGNDVCDEFTIDIDATSCAMYGFDFDKGTIEWWRKNVPANEHFKGFHYACCIAFALESFADALTSWKEVTGSDEIVVWSQGTDLDIAVLRNAFRVVFGNEDKLPWKYNNVRDARTYFLEAVRLFIPEVEKPYGIIKSEDGETQHHAIDDLKWSIRAVQWANAHINALMGLSFILTDKINRPKAEETAKKLQPEIDAGEPVMWELKKPLIDEVRADVKYALPAGTKMVLKKRSADESNGYKGGIGYTVMETAMPLNGFILRPEKVAEYFIPFRRLSNDEKVKFELSD